MCKTLSSFGVLSLVCCALAAPAAAELSAGDALARLKTLAGSWHGVPEGHGEEAEAEAAATPEIEHDIRVSAAGTVVMETMNPGTEHEMINMYYVDGEDLVLTHYCSGGNQPTMRLDREASSAESLVFDFTGGTNLDPAVDEHIHSATLGLGEENRIESAWTAYAGGEPAGQMIFHLARRE